MKKGVIFMKHRVDARVQLLTIKAKTHYCDPTRPNPTRPDFVGDPGRRPGLPTKSGRRQVCD